MSWRVETVMTRNVVTVRPTTPYKEIVGLMAKHGISAVPVVDVVDSDGRLVGIVSEADLLLKEEERTDVQTSRGNARIAADLMTAPVITVDPEATLAGAARVMHDKHVKRLSVVDHRERLVGIVSRGDLLKPFWRSDESIRSEVDEEVFRRALGVVPGEGVVSVRDGVVTVDVEAPERTPVPLVVRLVCGVEGVVGANVRLSTPVEPGVTQAPSGVQAAEWRPASG
jgi:CBS domain-containing protein